jgi:acetoin utilization deacetylase AcuC-like enzyme
VGRVLVVDCDVHQGDGTARIFAGRSDVLTLSLHAERNYPARKARSHLDFPLPDGLADRPYLEVLAHALAATDGVRPDLVFYNAGVDPHAEDRLGRLALTDAGLRARDALVLAWARARRIPLAGVLGGGYDHDPARLAARHALVFEEAARARDAAA